MGFSIQDYNLGDSFQIERTLLSLSGFYPFKNKKSSWTYMRAFFNLFVIFGQSLSMVIQMGIDRNDLSKLTQTLLIFITDLTFICKLMNFIYYKKNMFVIEATLERPIFYGYSYEALELLKNKIGSCQFLAKVFRVMCFLVVLFNCLGPYFNHQKKKSLPLPGWMPYDTKKYYYTTAIFQVMSVAISAYNNSTIDILTCILITVASAEFDILKENLKHINYKSCNKNSKIMVEKKFSHCVSQHKEITKFASLVEATFSKGIFLQFFASIVVICFTGFQMIVVPIPSVQFIFLIVYFSCMMCQIAMYCWYGHDIFTTTNSIGEFFYMSDWYESDISIRKNMLIFMERIKKPVSITAGNVVTLSLTTLTTILRSSYSYFAVLQRMYTEDD